MICESPITKGANKGKSARGTITGYYRHVHAGGVACDECRGAARDAGRRRRKKPESDRLPTARTEPAFVGSRSVRCRGCGARGSVNRRVKWAGDECVNCRGEA